MNYYLEVIPNQANKIHFEAWLGSKPPNVLHSVLCLSIWPQGPQTASGCFMKPFSPQR